MSKNLPPTRPSIDPIEIDTEITTLAPAAAPQTALTLSMEQLQALINGAVQAAVTASGQQSGAQLGTELGDAIATAMAKNAPRRKVTIGEYDPKTFVQPDKTKTLKLRRESYQNGTHMDAHVLSNPEIALLNQITHSGRYIDRMVEVFIASNGSEEEVYLRYNNRTPDHRNNNSRKWTSLVHMLQQIVDAQVAEDKEAAEMKSAMAELRRRAQKPAAV